MSAETLAHRLDAHRGRLIGYCRQHGGRLLRYETADDLAQGVQLAAVQRAARFELRTEGEFEAWLYTVARGFLANRSAYWSAQKRRSGRLLRITSSPDARLAGDGVVREPALAATGPSTFAARREQIVLATKALSLLLARDQQLVRWYSEDVPLTEQAELLGLGYDALRAAQRRALERFRRSFRLVTE